jgi:hypothetical protein
VQFAERKGRFAALSAFGAKIDDPGSIWPERCYTDRAICFRDLLA